MNKIMGRKQWAEVLGCTLAVLIVCGLPFLNPDLIVGSDTMFHILRIESLANVLKTGQPLPARVYSLMQGGYGYAAGLFYPDLFLLPAAAARALGLGPELAYKFHMMLCCLLQCVTCYFAAKGISKSHFGGCLMILLYGLGQYRLVCIFARGAMGEVQAMIFLPLVIWGLWNLTEEGAKRPWILFLGFTGLVLSHTVSLAIMGVFAVVWVLVRLPRVLNRRAILSGCGAAAACLLVSCGYWLPVLEQFASQKFRVSEKPFTVLANESIDLKALVGLKSYWGVGLAGLVLVAVGLVWAILRFKKERLAAWVMMGAGVFVALCTLGWFPWALVDKTPLKSIQFPWRLNGLSYYLICIGAVLLLTGIRGKGKRLGILVLALVISAAQLMILWPRFHSPSNIPADFSAQRETTFQLGAGAEWLPSEVNTETFCNEAPAQWTNAQGSFEGEYRANGDFVLEFEGVAGPYGIPKMYYKGYTARLYPQGSEDAVEIPFHKDSAGRIELDVPQGLPSGEIVVRYAGTFLQHLADWVSAAAVLCLCGLGIAHVLRKRK